MTLPIFLLFIVFAAYFLAFVFYLVNFLHDDGSSSAGPNLPVFFGAARFVEIGFLTHTTAIFVQTFTSSRAVPYQLHLPVTTLGEASGFFAWSLAFIYLVLVRRMKSESFGLVLTPIILFFLIPSLFPDQANPPWLLYFRDTYFLIHVQSAFFGYAGFCLSFIAGVLYWAQDRALKRKTGWNFYHRFPSLEELERFVFRSISWGLLLLAAAIISGAFWARSVFGSFFLREPKSILSILTWCAYLAIFYLHEVSLIKGRRVVLMSIGAFALVLFTFIRTGLIQSGIHTGVR